MQETSALKEEPRHRRQPHDRGKWKAKPPFSAVGFQDPFNFG